MSPPNYLVVLEDSLPYVELLTHELKSEWPECRIQHIEKKADFVRVLEAGGFDAILSDYYMGGFQGLDALALTRQYRPESPFIFVSGALEEEVGIESLKLGANDYVFKNRIVRLVPAILRAINEAAESRRRRELELANLKSEAFKGAILQAALDCIVVMDEQGGIVEFNPAAERAFGCSRAEIIGRHFIDTFVSAAHRENVSRCWNEVEGNEHGKRMEITVHRIDGSVFPAEITMVRTRVNDQATLIAFVRNIIERHQAEEQVRQAYAALEASNNNLVMRNRDIQTFYHTLSHELKTPLTSAQEFISIVIDQIPGPINAKQAEFLAIAEDSCQLMKACINDLLDTSRLETGKLSLQLELAGLDKLIKQTTTSVSFKAAKSGITLTANVAADLPEISMDGYRITQVLTNLLNNALNHTPALGQIWIAAYQAPGRPEWIHVSVGDTGCGVPLEEQAKIFERFYQLKTGSATTQHGFGMGLYLCRELVEMHGGRIWVESEPGVGSVFSFILPKNQESLRSHVLIMDDDAEILEISAEILRTKYIVRTACGGRAGIDEIIQEMPDVILLDLDMPDLNGPQTLKEIRKNWGTSIPIIIYTAHSVGPLMKQAMEYSPFILLSKPCRAQQMIETVGQLLESSGPPSWARTVNRREPSLFSAAN